MPNGNVGIGDGTDISSSDGLVRYRQISLTVSVDDIRSRSPYAHRHAVASAEAGQEDLQDCRSAGTICGSDAVRRGELPVRLPGERSPGNPGYRPIRSITFRTEATQARRTRIRNGYQPFGSPASTRPSLRNNPTRRESFTCESRETGRGDRSANVW